jgi:hypothetical protein
MYSSKNVSWVYLVKYFWAKNGVFGDLLAKTCAKPPAFSPFSYISGGWKAYLTSMTPSTTTPGPGASDCGRGMTQSLPLSYWSPEKSYMTSSRTATLIYIAARFRVNVITMLITLILQEKVDLLKMEKGR